jgi:hypothetical protein
VVKREYDWQEEAVGRWPPGKKDFFSLFFFFFCFFLNFFVFIFAECRHSAKSLPSARKIALGKDRFAG